MTLQLLMLISSGCAFSRNAEKPGYQAGRIAAVTFMLTEDVQSPSTRTAIVIAYRVICAITDGEVPEDVEDDIDTAIAEEVAEIGRDLESESSEVLQSLAAQALTLMRNRIKAELGDIDVLADTTILSNFREGIDDALLDYGYRTIENEPAK
jgi:hypothetical protein